MGRRALIIGIEDYGSVSDNSIAAKLQGTLKSAVDFKAWLVAKWDVEGVPEGDRQIIFCSEPIVDGGRHATAEDLTQALLDLKSAGQNSTEEFFFYFSGHGFSFVEPDARSDVLIASNYKAMQLSGGACMKLDKAIYWLRQHLGFGRQFYFVDACRNDLDGRKVNPGGIIPPSDPQTSGEATTYLLQSTAPAATAAVDGKFAAALLDGLKGRGTAKTWDEAEDDTMIVRFDTLRGFVRDRMTVQRIYNNVAGSDGETDGVLARLKPAPSSSCSVRISGDQQSPSGTISTTGRRNRTRLEVPIAGATTTFALKPDRYRVEVEVADGELQDDIRDVVVFDDTELVFNRVEPGGVARLNVPDVAAEIVIPKDLTVELQDWATGSRQIFEGIKRAAIPRGSYATIVRDARRQVVKSDELIVDAGTSTGVADWSESLPHASIAERFPVENGSVSFSESIGPLADPDLNVWLAILGGGRIMAGAAHTDYSKIGNLPLFDFEHGDPGDAPVYVLGAFDDPACSLEVKVSTDAERNWRKAARAEGMPGIRECLVATVAGEALIALRLNGSPPISISSKTFGSFATFLTATIDTNGGPVISQYVLPMTRFLNQNPAIARRFFNRNPLSDVKMLAEAQRAYRHRRDLRKALPDAFWQAVRGEEWFDPIAMALAGYELVRRGLDGERRTLLSFLVQKLAASFPGFPDLWHLRFILEQPQTSQPPPLPIFLDGLRVTEFSELPLPESHLDYGSPWTAWRGVVL